MNKLAMLLAASVVLALASLANAQDQDPYEKYLKTSKDFQPVNQDKAWLYKAWPAWYYMPWYFQWTIGHDDPAGKFSLDHGYNGAFLDNGNAGYLDWINKFQLHFYMDHTAAKGDLHLWDGGSVKPHLDQIHSGGVRTKPLNDAMKTRLEGIIKRNIEAVKSSPMRSAYSLDDEAGWGHFVHPCMWQATDDKQAYQKWLTEIYGPAAPKRDNWITYKDILPKLSEWSLAQFDASQLMDQWSFNDSYYLNFIGDLVEYANTIDPATPAGLVGCQSPSAFGGYDYAKLMRKVQFIEAYNLGSSAAIIRSFNPHNAIPAVTTHFHRDVDDTIWQSWYYLAHGNRGFIGWVEGWFTDSQPADWHEKVAPTYLQIGSKIAPALAGAEWADDGVAIYYSHPSIQLSWILDAQAHRNTWTNRNDDHKLGSSHLVRLAWENMLRDEGLQYNFISYADVVREGIPAKYKVLILPGCIALSDAEAKKIKEFCKNGGTVIADYLPGLWDQHGKGRANGGALDDMFGVKHDGGLKPGDLFTGRLWVETDQDANFGYKTCRDLMTNANSCIKDESGFYKAVRKGEVGKTAAFGKGKAVLMNLSPQWYNAYRESGFESCKKRITFMKPLHDAGLSRWVEIAGAGEKEFGYEISYFVKDGRTFLFVVFNPQVVGSQTGGGNSKGLKTDTLDIRLLFAKDIKNVRDERTGQKLPDGREFKLTWKMNEAVVLSFEKGN